MAQGALGQSSLEGMILGHYRIVEKIGDGGMGTVYLAHDEHLDRRVAVKVLPLGSLVDELARKRFRIEALALSRLNHPNIETVHDFDSDGGIDYLAGEFIEGRSLRDLVTAGAQPQREVLRLGIQLAEGVVAAHEKGVVHRDLKPENIRVTPDGRLKILDFGLAVLDPTSNLSTTTKSVLSIAGTIPYMAPEQLRGQEVDRRVDIWAIGAVLYEMATGRLPFPQTGPPLIDAILNREIVPASQLNRDVSPTFDRVVSRSLEKDPGRRYQTAEDLLFDLRKLATVSPARKPSRMIVKGSSHGASRYPSCGNRKSRARGRSNGSVDVKSLVVLPLGDFSPGGSEEYFADGMTDTLISALAKVRSLRVISRTSAMRYKGTEKSLPQIAAELGADVVVEGSVLRAGGRLRITLQLVDAATDSPVWAESYERSSCDVLMLQSEVARAVAEQIRVELSPEEKNRLAQRKPVNAEAYDLYLKGMFHWYKLSREHQEIANNYFDLALRKDPSCALAYAGRALVWYTWGDSGFIAPHEAFQHGKAAALKAVELDDSLPEIHVALAFYRVCEYDWPAAEVGYQRAIQLGPNSAHARFLYADFLISMGRREEARYQMDEVLRLDPFNPAYECFGSWHLLYDGNYDDALAAALKVIAAEPDFPAAHLALWGSYFCLARYADALAEARIFFFLLRDSEVTSVFSDARTRKEYEGVMKAAAEVLAARATKTYVPCIRVARFYAHAADVERAIDWLEKARTNRESTLLHLSVGWDWRGLRQHPRFKNLQGALGLPTNS